MPTTPTNQTTEASTLLFLAAELNEYLPAGDAKTEATEDLNDVIKMFRDAGLRSDEDAAVAMAATILGELRDEFVSRAAKLINEITDGVK